ncbi:hypothetical protein V6N13_023175 [Hibiscus sabdariffa]
MRIERGGAPKMDCHADASNDLLLPIIGNKLGDEDFDSCYCGSSSTSVSHSELVIGDKANPPIDVEEISHIELEVHAGFGPW